MCCQMTWLICIVQVGVSLWEHWMSLSNLVSWCTFTWKFSVACWDYDLLINVERVGYLASSMHQPSYTVHDISNRIPQDWLSLELILLVLGDSDTIVISRSSIQKEVGLSYSLMLLFVALKKMILKLLPLWLGI